MAEIEVFGHSVGGGIRHQFIRYTLPFAVSYLAEVIFLLSRQAILGERADYGWLTQWIQGGYGPGSYYYPVMIQLIFLFPIIYFVVKRFHLKGLLICAGVNGAYEILKSMIGMGEGWYRLLVFRYILLIGFGCYIFMNKLDLLHYIIFNVAACIGIYYIFRVQYTDYVPKILCFWSGTSFVASMYIVPIVGYILTSPRCMGLQCRALEQLGRASYHIFLVQMVYYHFFSGLLYKILKSRTAAFIAGSIVCLTGGFLFYRLENKLTGYIAVQAGNDKRYIKKIKWRQKHVK